MFNKLNKINSALIKKFGKEDAFRIMTRLAEECGELAEQVNHFEGSGMKKEKNGTPDKKKLAKEVQDVIRCTLQIADHYKIHKELSDSIEESYNSLKDQKLID